MLTTPELRRQFEISFMRVIKSLPLDIQKKWDGVITWPDDHSYPTIQPEFIRLLPPPARSMYVSLLNKLSRG